MRASPVAAFLLIAVAAALGAAQIPPEAASAQLVGITAPFQTAVMASTQLGRIEEIRFPEGSYVDQGDIVVLLEDGVQRARTELARITMETTLPVDLERAKLVRSHRDLDRLRRLHGGDYASSKELTDALSTSEIAEVSYDLAQFQQEQSALAYERERALLEEYRLSAPFPAYVAAHLKHPGETVDHQEGILRLVQLDPLLVTMDCPLELAGGIAQGQLYPVRPVGPVGAQSQERIGTVVFASALADAASQTFRVKLSVDNKDHGWMAGCKVLVDFADGRTSTKTEERRAAAQETAASSARMPTRR